MQPPGCLFHLCGPLYPHSFKPHGNAHSWEFSPEGRNAQELSTPVLPRTLVSLLLSASGRATALIAPASLFGIQNH